MDQRPRWGGMEVVMLKIFLQISLKRMPIGGLILIDGNIFTIKDLPKYEKSIYNDKKINLQYKDEEVADKSLKEISPETKCINGYYDFTRRRNRNSFMHPYDTVNFKVGKKPYPDVKYDKHGKVIDEGEYDKEGSRR